MKKLLALLLLVSSYAFGGTVTGTITTATAGPIVNGTLTLTPTQAFVVAGTATVVSSAVSCYTDAFGNVVGEPNPLLAPVVTANTATGTLAAGTYFTVIAYYDGTGTSFYSPETTTVLSATGELIVTAPVKQPAGATGYKVFIGATTGSETLQSSVTGFGNYTQSATLAAGSALPSTNTTACKPYFNDEGSPVAAYKALLTNSSGSTIAGFPQRWQLMGGAAGTVNLSNGTPLWNGFVQYPQAIITTPAFNATQSIAGGLNLNGFPLLGVSTFAASGNATVGGTLAVTGATTLANTTLGAASTLNVANLKQIPNSAFVISDGLGVTRFLMASTSPYVNTFISANGAGSVFLGSASKMSVDDVTGNITMSGSSSGTTVIKPSAVASGTLTLPAATDTLVGKATTDILTNKTLSSPQINGTPTGTGIPTLTLKKGSGAGNYTSASTTYVVVDATNLCYTVTIPVGWKLQIGLALTAGTLTAAAAFSVAITDNASCSTANAGILQELNSSASSSGISLGMPLGWVITGDGASHSVALQAKTTNASDSVFISNGSATNLPTMTFNLSPSN